MSQKCKTEAVQIHKIELPTHFAVGPVNSFVLIEGRERILVDCGPKLDITKKALLEGLHRIQLSVEDITGVVLTHGHVDHVGLTSMFQKRNIPIYGLPSVSSWLDKDSPGEHYRCAFLQTYYPKMGMPSSFIEKAFKEYFYYQEMNDRSVVDAALIPGEQFAPLPMFKILHVPGHAQAAIALWCEESGQLIIGDQLLPHISSNALIEPIPGARSGAEAKRTKSLIQYRENMKLLKKLPIQVVYPGHGEIFTHAHDLIEQRLAEQVKRRDKLLRLLTEKGHATAFELACLYFPNHLDQGSLILSETLGHLDWLEEEGLAVSQTTSDGLVMWRAG